jgi:hypothetical protein
MTSTALVPASMYDTLTEIDTGNDGQAGAPPWSPGVSEEIREYNRKAWAHRHRRDEMAAIKATIQDICIEGALSILDAFGYRGTQFHCDGDAWDTDDLVNEQHFPECQGRLARETPVFWFWGGPPSKLKWYEGTLQTLLEDRILCEIMERGATEVAEWIGIDFAKGTQ